MKKIPVSLFLLLQLLFIGCDTNTMQNEKPKNQTNPLPAFTSGYASLKELNMYYEVHGNGAPLVLIHGGGSTIRSNFSKLIPELSKHRKVIAMELQAHGRTADRDLPETFEQDADDVAELLHFLKIDKADILGFSNGGNTTMQLALRHPALVDKIIVSSSFYKRSGLPAQFWESIGKASLKDMPEELKKAYLEVNPDTNGLLRMFTKDRDRMTTFKDWKAENLRAIKATTLILIGDKDVVSPEHAVEMYRLIPNSQLAILPGGHGDYLGESSSHNTAGDSFLTALNLIRQFLK